MASLQFSYIRFIMKGRRLLFQFLSAIITFFIVYLLVSSLFLKDFATSLEPGWHTTIYPPRWRGPTYPFDNAFMFTLAILVSTLFVYLLFKYLFRFLTFIGLKVFSLQPDGKRTNR